MITLRRRCKQSTAEGLSTEEENIRTNQRKNNGPINLHDDDDDDDNNEPPPLFQYESNSGNEEDCVEVVEINTLHRRSGRKLQQRCMVWKASICAARPRKDEEIEHLKTQASMWGFMSLPKEPKIKKSRPGMVAPPLEPISEDITLWWREIGEEALIYCWRLRWICLLS